MAKTMKKQNLRIQMFAGNFFFTFFGVEQTNVFLVLIVTMVILKLKAPFFWKGHGGHEFKLFPANIWILKFCYFTVFAIKMLLDKPFWLMNLLEIKYNHFRKSLSSRISISKFKCWREIAWIRVLHALFKKRCL